MMKNPINETGEQSVPPPERMEKSDRLETLDDIPREIAGRRLQREFSEAMPPERLEALKSPADQIENREDFTRTALENGLLEIEGVLGYSTKLEDPAHVLKGDVGKEIATLIHEDLHRVTHPETLREAHANSELHDLYEGVTEYFTTRASEGLHGFKEGECYPRQVKKARELANEVGEEAMKEWYFRNEVSEELQQALERLQS